MESLVVDPTVRDLRRSARLGCKRERELMPLKERSVGVTKKSARFEHCASRQGEVPGLGKGPHMTHAEMIDSINKIAMQLHAERALKLYEKSQDAEFETVEVLSYESKLIGCDKWKDPKIWCHVTFTAKPKNVDVSSLKHLFGELLFTAGTWKAKHCSMFEPSGDPGFNHGCVICPSGQKLHPGIHGYVRGCPPVYYECKYAMC